MLSLDSGGLSTDAATVNTVMLLMLLLKLQPVTFQCICFFQVFFVNAVESAHSLLQRFSRFNQHVYMLKPLCKYVKLQFLQWPLDAGSKNCTEVAEKSLNILFKIHFIIDIKVSIAHLI